MPTCVYYKKLNKHDPFAFIRKWVAHCPFPRKEKRFLNAPLGRKHVPRWRQSENCCLSCPRNCNGFPRTRLLCLASSHSGHYSMPGAFVHAVHLACAATPVSCNTSFGLLLIPALEFIPSKKVARCSSGGWWYLIFCIGSQWMNKILQAISARIIWVASLVAKTCFNSLIF